MIKEPVLAITRLKHLTGSAVCLLACSAGQHVTGGGSPAIPLLMVSVLLLSWWFRRGVSDLLEGLEWGVQLVLVLYYMVAAFVLLSLLAAEPGELHGVILVLLVCQLGLCVLIVVDWGYPVTLFNSLLLMISAMIIAPGGIQAWGVGYMVLMMLALLTRHQELRLHDFPVSRSVRVAPTMRQGLLACGILIALQLAILPIFPDLRVKISLLLPVQAGGEQPNTIWLILFVQLIVVLGLAVLAVHLLRKFLGTLRPETRAAPSHEIEELFQAPEARGQTRRITRLRIFQNARERVVEEYCWLLRRLSRQGHHRPRFQTGKEFLGLVDRHRPEILETLEELTGLFYRARYGIQPMTRQDVLEAHRLTRAILAKAPP